MMIDEFHWSTMYLNIKIFTLYFLKNITLGESAFWWKYPKLNVPGGECARRWISRGECAVVNVPRGESSGHPITRLVRYSRKDKARFLTHKLRDLDCGTVSLNTSRSLLYSFFTCWSRLSSFTCSVLLARTFERILRSRILRVTVLNMPLTVNSYEWPSFRNIFF